MLTAFITINYTHNYTHLQTTLAHPHAAVWTCHHQLPILLIQIRPLFCSLAS